MFKLLVLDSNRQSPCGNPDILPTILVVAVVLALCPGLFVLHYAPAWPPAPCLQQ